MHNSYQRCGDACVRPHGSLRCSGRCSAWCSPVSLLLPAIGVSSDSLQLCSLVGLCAAFAKWRTRLCCMHCVQFGPCQNS